MATERFTWSTAAPAAHGFDEAKLDSLWESLAARQTRTFLLIRNDTVIYERYATGWHAGRPHYTASLAKALVGGMSLLLALDEGRLSADEPACNVIPQWKTDPGKAQITIRHLATHSAGIEDAELSPAERAAALAGGQSRTDHHLSLPGWKGAFWQREPDPFTPARDQAPLIFQPGTAFAYSNPGMAMLAYAVTTALQGSPRPDIRTLLQERIIEPLGIPAEAWSIGYGQTYSVDGLPLVANWGGGNVTPRAVARIGRLMLRRGEWEGRQLINPARVQEVLAYAGTPLPDRTALGPYPGSGLGWYTNFDRVWPTVPDDAFAGAGAGHQVLLVIPSLNLIMVRNGESLDDSMSFWEALETHLFNPLLNALMIQPPYPASRVISELCWDPPSKIARLAGGGRTRDGSDNWPLTWADDGHLYTAYGDGYGFDPILPAKLGLGFGVVMGHPESGLTTLNIRSSAENSRYGRHGKKASGLLMVDGVLYLLVRNANGDGGGSQLAWSTDYARSWQWADWQFEGLGYPTFINFGPNYAGARDDYVYLVSHDHPSAYRTADHFVLARVRQDQLRDRAAYQFYQSLDRRGAPVWSPEIADRGPIFTNPGHCCRSGISYHAPLQRYLWWQQLRATGEQKGDDQAIDTRFQGGFGIYEAPEPWGPWHTVYFTESWDVGPGDTASFPPKWISGDGKTLYLVFSGNDSFSVRRAVLTI